MIRRDDKKIKPLPCPECVAGKCDNCTGQALDEKTDQFALCACPSCGGALKGWGHGE